MLPLAFRYLFPPSRNVHEIFTANKKPTRRHNEPNLRQSDVRSRVPAELGENNATCSYSPHRIFVNFRSDFQNVCRPKKNPTLDKKKIVGFYFRLSELIYGLCKEFTF